MIKVITLKLNTQYEWDKVIFEWLERIPPGERSAMIKYFLWRVITGESLEGLTRSSSVGSEEKVVQKSEVSEKLLKKLDSLEF